jgi:hypothetical protein
VVINYSEYLQPAAFTYATRDTKQEIFVMQRYQKEKKKPFL